MLELEIHLAYRSSRVDFVVLRENGAKLRVKLLHPQEQGVTAVKSFFRGASIKVVRHWREKYLLDDLLR